MGRTQKKTALMREIEGLIRDMDLPTNRKMILQKEDSRWLLRNMRIRNHNHPNFNKADELLKDLLNFRG